MADTPYTASLVVGFPESHTVTREVHMEGHNHMPGIAQSRYRQLRLTITHETNGRLSYRLLAKGLNEGWSEHHVIDVGSVQHTLPILSTEDAIVVVIDMLRGRLLPGIG